jgi:secreted protein with Ig-like and vWFA domain
MNHDTPISLPDESGNDLEARVVAAVLGEASAFETAELERLVSTNPELAVFKRRIEAVHGLIGLAVRPEQAPMRLAPERRAKILQAIGAPSTAPIPPENDPVILKFAQARRVRQRRWIWMSGIAASLMFAAILGVYVAPASRRLYEERRPQRVALPGSEVGDHDQVSALIAPEVSQDQPNAVVMALPAASPPSDIADNEFKRQTDQFKARGFAQSGSFGAAFVPKQRPSFGKDGGTSYYISPSAAAGNELKKETAPAGNFIEESARVVEDDATGEKILRLSPFEVSAPEERGYMASSTLAGSRLNTKLTDVAGSLHVLTPEFLSDMQAKPADDNFLSDRSSTDVAGTAQALLQQTQSSEAGGIAGNFANPQNTRLFGLPAMDDKRLSQKKSAAAPAARADAPQGEISTAKEAVSTFSLHVSDVSFRIAQAALARGETPDPARIRPEEFYNAFDYGDPAPTAADKIGCRIEQSAHPFLQQRNLVRIAMRVPSAGRGATQPLHLTVLLDTSGSMEREDRIASVHRALAVLGSLLNANDRITLIGFAREPRLLVENLPGDQAANLVQLASQTPFTGGTNLEEALKLSGELAQRHQDAAAQNRIVFITDGAANLGNADPAQLGAMVETLRQQGIAFDACGVGTDGLDDAVLEALTRKGNGRYYVLDTPADADAGFARQLAGAFRPAAENVKVQVRFNPARVGSYQLIGFEQHRLKTEDFRNDKVDAAELAADEAAVALYQVEVLPQGEGELGEVFVRFRDAASGQMVERSWTMPHEEHVRAFDRANPSVQLAGAAALLAEKLRGGDSANQVDLGQLTPVVNSLRGHYASNGRVQELITMFEQLRRQSGK